MPSTIHQQQEAQPPAHPPSTCDLPRRPPRQAADAIHLTPHHLVDSFRDHTSNYTHPHWPDFTNVGHTPRGTNIRWQGHRQRKTTTTTLRHQLRRPIRLHSPNPNGPCRPLHCPPAQNSGRHILHFTIIRNHIANPNRPINPSPTRGCRKNKKRIIPR